MFKTVLGQRVLYLLFYFPAGTIIKKEVSENDIKRRSSKLQECLSNLIKELVVEKSVVSYKIFTYFVSLLLILVLYNFVGLL